MKVATISGWSAFWVWWLVNKSTTSMSTCLKGMRFGNPHSNALQNEQGSESLACRQVHIQSEWVLENSLYNKATRRLTLHVWTSAGALALRKA